MGGTRRPDIHDPQNLVSVCGAGNADRCHGRIHSRPVDATFAGWTIPKESTVDALAVPVMIRGKWKLLTADGLVVVAG